MTDINGPSSAPTNGNIAGTAAGLSGRRRGPGGLPGKHYELLPAPEGFLLL
jgi:hypothetical protein